MLLSQLQNLRRSCRQIRVEFGTSSLVYMTAQAFNVLEVLLAVVASRFAIAAVSAFVPHRADQSVNFLEVGVQLLGRGTVDPTYFALHGVHRLGLILCSRFRAVHYQHGYLEPDVARMRRVEGHAACRTRRLVTHQVRELRRLGVHQVAVGTVHQTEMMMHCLCPADELAAQEAISGEKRATCAFPQQGIPTALVDQGQKSGSKLMLLDGVQFLLGQLRYGAWVQDQSRRCILRKGCHRSGLALLKRGVLAAALNMYHETSPGSEGLVTHGTLRKAMFHVLCRIRDMTPISGEIMGTSHLSTQHWQMKSGKFTQRAGQALGRSGLFHCKLSTGYGQAFGMLMLDEINGLLQSSPIKCLAQIKTCRMLMQLGD